MVAKEAAEGDPRHEAPERKEADDAEQHHQDTDVCGITGSLFCHLAASILMRPPAIIQQPN